MGFNNRLQEEQILPIFFNFTLCKYNCLIIPVCFGGQADVLGLDVDNDENRLRAILADLEEDKFLVMLDLVLAKKMFIQSP